MKNILFIAPPAGGKGTLSDKLVENYGYIHISTGDLLRDVDKTTELGQKVKSIMDSGALVSDEIVIDLLKEKLSTLKNDDAFILDGFPRNIAQAEKLEDLLEELGLSLDCAIELNVPFDVIVKRALGRVSCPNCKATYNTFFIPTKIEGKCDKCGNDLIRRESDNEETMKVRYDVYMESTEPLVDFYKKREKLYTIDGVNAPYEALVSVIK